MSLPLEGQVAIVTGGAGLIGRAICQRLAAEGAKVVVNGRKVEKINDFVAELTAAGYTALGAPANVTDEDQVRGMMKLVLDTYGRIDIMVNNAGGGGGARGHVEDIPLDRWLYVLGSNLTSTFLCSKHTIPTMRAQGYGRFINISSAGAFGVMGGAGYASAKAGLEVLTKTVALENADAGITANVVVPHLTESPRTVGQQPPANLAFPVPIKRYGKPEEIAGAVYFFCSPDSAYITGEILRVTGGLQWFGPTYDAAENPRV